MTAAQLWVACCALILAALFLLALVAFSVRPQRIPPERSVEGIRQRIERESESEAEDP
ncbi:hypothetical protein DFR70_108200 [Nocardia tenerifensis]|uniref:Uncharacterized protein n=1 Tax=Nocardia tenerifensis TaxID=228006 RepID=A0A318KAC0_9NOCA|nr:hypothetical protein [Nocardia tenerifensis]PXX61642.1 hypothetical protein DFR70_108200 [Nocardia tenerifensis]